MCPSASGRLVTTLLLVGFLAACGDDGPTGSDFHPPELQPQPKKAWTFLFYDDAEFQGYDPFDDFSSRMRSGENIHVVLLRDDEVNPTETYWVRDIGYPILVKKNGELNLGDPETLRQFVAFAKEYYPADRYILSFYDHGMSWRGSCIDVTSGNDFLSMGEKKTALQQVGGVDVVLFSAPCNMGSFEAVYNLRDQTDLYIGSPNTSGFVFWRDPMADLASLLDTNPSIELEELADAIISSVWAHKGTWMPDLWQDALTMTAVRTDGLGAVADALDALALSYLGHSAEFVAVWEEVAPELTTYGPSLVDLGDLVGRFLTVEDDPDRLAALAGLQDALDEVILCECHGTAWPRGAGLNLFLPGEDRAYRLTYYLDQNTGLDIVPDTHWDDLLMEIHPAATAENWFEAPWASEWLPSEIPFQTDGFSSYFGKSCR